MHNTNALIVIALAMAISFAFYHGYTTPGGTYGDGDPDEVLLSRDGAAR